MGEEREVGVVMKTLTLLEVAEGRGLGRALLLSTVPRLLLWKI